MSLTCSTIFAATLVISSSIQAMLTLNKTLFCTGLLLTQSNPSKWNSVKGSFIWICLQLKTMQSLSETPTWVMNWQLFLNNPNIDKWKRLRVKKSKLFTEQRHDKYTSSLAQILFALRQKSKFGQIRNPGAVSRCSKYLFLLSEIYFPVASTAYLRQKGQAQQIIGEITRDFEGVRVSQLEATFFEVLLYLANSRYCISVEIVVEIARYWRL